MNALKAENEMLRAEIAHLRGEGPPITPSESEIIPPSEIYARDCGLPGTTSRGDPVVMNVTPL